MFTGRNGPFSKQHLVSERLVLRYNPPTKPGLEIPAIAADAYTVAGRTHQ